MTAGGWGGEEGGGGAGVWGYPRWDSAESIHADTKYGRIGVLRSHKSKTLLLASLGDWRPTGSRNPPTTRYYHHPPRPPNPPT